MILDCRSCSNRSRSPGTLLRLLTFALFAGPIATGLSASSSAPLVQSATRGFCPLAEGIRAADCNEEIQAICTLAARGSLVEALKAGRTALEKYPHDSLLLNNVGCIILFALGKPSWSRAEDYFQQALKNNAVNAAAMYNYAMLLSLSPHSHRHNKKCSARQLFRAACQLDPALPSAVLKARDILVKSGSCMQLQEMDDIESSSSTASSRDTMQNVDIFDESSFGVDSRSEVAFGIHSRAHARTMLSSGNRDGGPASNTSSAKVGSKERQSAGRNDEMGQSGARRHPKSGVLSNAERGGGSCITAVRSGPMAALVFCTTLAQNKVLLCDGSLLLRCVGFQTLCFTV